MTIGIVGLGLIGGSLCKAFKYAGNLTVLGTDREKTITKIAEMSDFIDGDLEGREGECDFIFIAVDAISTINYLQEKGDLFKKGCILCDCCGVKEIICDKAFEIAKEKGFHFVGGHPMAGTQFSGLKHSRYDLFVGANMVLIPKHEEDMQVLQSLKDVLTLAGFKSVSITNARNHDRIIAFTSQLAHVVSNAYVKSPTATNHKGFSAGSYKDLTRVAWLNEDMWANLFLQNADNISFELENLISQLQKYQLAIKNKDFDTLRKLLKEGKEQKIRCDK